MFVDLRVSRFKEKLSILGDMAETIAKFSRDPSTKVGAIIVDALWRPVSWGYNGFPSGMSDEKEWYENREMKLERVIHAELNAILNMKNNTGLYENVMVCTHHPCHRCMTAIIQAKIKTVYYIERPQWETKDSNLIKSLELSKQFAKEANLPLVPLNKKEK